MIGRDRRWSLRRAKGENILTHARFLRDDYSFGIKTSLTQTSIAGPRGANVEYMTPVIHASTKEMTLQTGVFFTSLSLIFSNYVLYLLHLRRTTFLFVVCWGFWIFTFCHYLLYILLGYFSCNYILILFCWHFLLGLFLMNVNCFWPF